jgi:ankyrin repeat protein
LQLIVEDEVAMADSTSIPANDDLAVAAKTAIENGDIPALKTLLDAHPKLARARIVDSKGAARTLLHLVADWPGHRPNGPEAVAVLVAAGADVNAAMPNGPTRSAETPLHWAASSDDIELIDALLEAGADIEAPGAVFTGGPPMSDAVIFAQWNAARRLYEHGARTTLWQAAALGLLTDVQRYVSVNPSPTRDDITNALWNACRGGQLDTAKYLIERGADPAWVGRDDKSPLDVARESENRELVEWLEQIRPIRGRRP